MRVLIAIDGSKASEVVLREALARTWPERSYFCLITVIDPFFFTRAPVLLEEAREGARQFLKNAAKGFEQKAWETSVEVVLGNPRRAISECAEEWRADLVMVGSQGLNALARLALGSTVQSVLRHTKCSVEIVRDTDRGAGLGGPASRVLIATDGSEFSATAVKAVAERPWPKETEVKVISVPEFSVWVGEFPTFQLKQVEELNKSALDAAKEAVASGAELLSQTGLKVTTYVVFEREAPAKTIVEEAARWNADLLVVGSHGRRGFDRLAMGSVSESVAMNAQCSVEVVHAGPSRQKVEMEEAGHESQRDHDGHPVHVS